MSVMGSRLETLVVQALAAQQAAAARQKDHERRSTIESVRRVQDQVDLKTAGVEAADAVRRFAEGEDRPDARGGRNRGTHTPLPDEHDGRPHIDVQA